MARETKSTMSKEDVRDLRSKLGMTQVEFAEEIGVAQATVSQWEAGLRKPDRRSFRLMEMLSEKKNLKNARSRLAT